MQLADLLTDSFPATIRSRGRDYYRSGAVDLVEGDSSEVHALVSGQYLYTVDLALTGDGLAVSCSCPYFDDAGVCKHVWATLLCAQDRGYLTDHWDTAESPMGGWREALDDFDDDGSDEAAFRPPVPARRGSPPRWDQRLGAISRGRDDDEARRWPAGREILYLFDPAQTRARGHLILEVVRRDLKRDGSWGKPKPQQIKAQLIPQLDQSSDRHIFSLLLGSQPWVGEPHHGGYRPGRYSSGGSISVPASVTDVLVPLICQTGRACTMSGPTGDELLALSWKEGPAWELCLEVKDDSAAGVIVVHGRLSRGDERVPLDRPQMLLAGGFVFGDDGVVEGLDDLGAFGWISSIRNHGPLVIPIAQADEFLSKLLSLPNLPRLDLPPALRYEEIRIAPHPHLRIRSGRSVHGRANPRLTGSLSFVYGGEIIAAEDGTGGIYRAPQKRFLLRDHDAEADAAETLEAMGFRSKRPGEYELAPSRLPQAVRALTDLGWHVEAEGRVHRSAGTTRMSVRSGIDWFELTGGVEFGDETAALPELLAALRRGEDFVPLGDGTVGLLPEEWLNRYRALAATGEIDGDAVRFKRTQIGLLDALLASQPEVTVDTAFTRARDRLRSFEGVEEAKEPATFVGELRGYQREGLGWMRFLQQFGFGGCLADDMGLGKTVQVLALLEARRRARNRGKSRKPPSLVVVPKSLMFNWFQEAQRFTPKLKILNHIGTRRAPGEHFDDFDVILTTYGTLRRDAAHLQEVKFDYCILDEAQAIKNPSTAAAKAARLIRAEHRLALSGTPIENHLGELWSLFEFLNPGILGTASAFKVGVNRHQSADDGTRDVLAQALRPFILRRTKEQVAKDLPPKTEQTMYCELGGMQRRYYEQLKNRFRRDLWNKVDRDGLERSKMLVLEALLRLRQAACHPGLIDTSKASESSAKLDLLIPQLVEVADEGHKALVFSQFTKLLAIVRQRLDREGVVYEYLDGRTRDRQAKVERFQSDPECRVFLISLKAGGLGLNLTAAEYVFLLDPWWNPAVEAQAIDRTHRIGQTNPVFAYRVIARDTVEEKVLQLQDSKRALADAIITADNSLIRHMRREDLELLFA
ncbi:MAG: helicase SNF2 [Actinobacteria bacterium]|nr:helicase SNF2 [Actinomycetota bacterium]